MAVRILFQRVKIFRKNVLKEKEVLGLLESMSTSPQSTLITVHRSRIVEVGSVYPYYYPLTQQSCGGDIGSVPYVCM